MQVLNDNVALLTNLEVGHLLRQEADAGRREAVDRRVLQFQSKLKGYLGGTQPLPPEEKAVDFLRRAEPYGLTPGELLNILNLRPKCFCHLFAIVEAPDERLNSDQIAKLLALCQDCFGSEGSGTSADAAPEPEQPAAFGGFVEERHTDPLWSSTQPPLGLEEEVFSFGDDDAFGDMGDD